MLPSKKDRKKQTRLSFSPAASSSPLRSEAHVRVDQPITPSKRRRFVSDSDSDPSHRKLSSDIAKAIDLSKQDQGLLRLQQSPQNEVDQLPTPERSSQVEPPGTDGRRQLRSRGVNFAKPILSAGTRQSPGFQHHQTISDSEDTRLARSNEKVKQRPQPFAVRSSSSESSDGESPRPIPSRPPTARSFLVGGTSGTAPIPRSRRRSRRYSQSNRTAKVEIDSSSSQEDTTIDREDPNGASTRYNTRQRKRDENRADKDDEDDSDVVPITPSRRRSSLKRVEVPNEEDDDEEEEDETDGNDDNDDDDDDSDIVPTTPSRRRFPPQPFQRAGEAEEDDAESDIVPITPSRKRLYSKRPDKPEDDDEDSMLEELGNADSEESQTRQTRQGQGNTARTKRMEQLSKLKKRRAGAVNLSDDNDSEQQELDEQHNEEQDDEQEEEGSEDREGSISSDEENGSKNSDEYESDFIEDDGEIGIDLIKHGVPLEFTGHANKKQYDYFKHAVEWMVHNKLDPAFERNDEIYELAHRKLNDEYLGLASSEFKSSVWTQDFINALQSRPEIESMHFGLGLMEERKCQACNRSGHPSKWILTFSGPRYDRRSLEKVSPKDVSDASSESDDATDTADERSEEWYVGSVCCANAEVTHSLYHWRFQLNATILQWLADNKQLEPLQVIEREEWSRRKKEKFANKIVDGMVETGEMETLYKEFKQNLEAAIAARNDKAQQQRWKGKRA